MEQNERESLNILAEISKDMVKFHEMERHEKNNAIRFYSVFIAGIIAIVISNGKLSDDLAGDIAKIGVILAILVVNILIVRKLIAVRVASNNIYRDYNRSVEFICNRLSDIENNNGYNEIFLNYGKVREHKKKLLPRWASDTIEIAGMSSITTLVPLALYVPLFSILNNPSVSSFLDSWGIVGCTLSVIIQILPIAMSALALGIVVTIILKAQKCGDYLGTK